MQATVEFALQREDLQAHFKDYLVHLVSEITKDSEQKIG